MRLINRNSQHFPLCFRLRCSRTFKQAFAQGTRVFQSSFVAYVVENSVSFARLGIVVSKRAVPRAVARNRLRRLVRESFRLNHAQLSGDIVLVIRRTAHDCSNAVLLKSLSELWQRVT